MKMCLEQGHDMCGKKVAGGLVLRAVVEVDDTRQWLAEIFRVDA